MRPGPGETDVIKRWLALSTIVAATACQGDPVQLPPPPADAGEPVVDAGTDVDTGTVVRTVETRSPFGNLDVADNLVLDGDFEFTGRQGQAPWIVFSGNGQATLDFATGGLCRSGVRCLSLAAGAEAVGWVAAPKAGGMHVSLWAKPLQGRPCADLQVAMADLDTSDGVDLPAETYGADARGWCHFTGEVGAFAGKQPAVYVGVTGNLAKGPVLVDEVVVRAVPATLSKRPAVVGPARLDDVRTRRIGELGGWIRTHRIYGLPPTPPPGTPDVRPAPKGPRR